MTEVGQSRRRVEDARFLTGAGRYIADLVPAGALHMHIVRSPHAHARVLGIDDAEAAAMPGVAGVFKAVDLAGLGPIPCGVAVNTVGPMHVPLRFALASDRVRYVGEPVAFVIAETATLAQDAAEAVAVEYDALPCVVEADAALQAGAPLVWDDVAGNLAFRFVKGDPGAVDRAMAGAAHVASVRVVNNRIIIASMEHRGLVATFHAASGVYMLTLSAAGVHVMRHMLAQSVFGVADEMVQVVCPDVGGGFGVKNALYPEYIAALWAARRLGRPVCWLSGHGEDFLSTAHGRDNLTEARLGLDAEGRFLALQVETVANLGAGMSSGGPGSSTNAPGNAMGCGYSIPAVAMSVRGAFTNTVPLDAYRGAGKPEANYLMERLVDAAAKLTGIDRVALRRRNLVHAFPHRTAMSTTIDCGRFAQNIDPALEAADAAGFANRRAGAPPGMLRGLGVTCFLETARGAPNEGAEIRFGADGRVSLLLGTQSNGQGHETVFPQIAADRLGLPHGSFDFVQADTRVVRDGNGHGGARSMHMGGSALVDAIDMVLAKGRVVAGRLLQAGVDEVSFQVVAGAGLFVVGERHVGLAEVARAAAEDPVGQSLDSYHWTLLDLITFPNGCHVAEVEVDQETGAVRLLRYTAADDFGTAINPMLLLGQIQGGLAQGIGQALTERTVYDPQSGQLLTGTYMDYAVPRASDLPDLDIVLLGEPTGSNPLGVKGAGQAGAIAAPPAVVAAVLDALAPLGVTHLDMPLTAESVWRAISGVRF